MRYLSVQASAEETGRPGRFRYSVIQAAGKI